MCKNPVLKNTSWAAVQEVFVADVGTMTITHTLAFVSDKDVVIKEVTVMPSHPAMYVNPDGTIDRIEGWTNEREKKGTYTFKRNTLIVTDEEGSTEEYTYQSDGTFTIKDPLLHETVVYSRKQD